MIRGAPLAAMSEFARHMVRSWDIDPVYPVLKQLISDLGLTPPEAEWLVILYLAYYEITSATTAFLRYPSPEDSGLLADRATLKLPTGIERRGLRDPVAMANHLMDWLERFDGESFFTSAREHFAPVAASVGPSEFHNDDVLDTYLQGVRYNGRWASYKAREVLHKVLGYPNAARDAGHENSTGPRTGLTLFFPAVPGNGPDSIRRLNDQTEVLRRAIGLHGVELTVEELETLLCDFKSLTRGKYYVGHDTDLMLEGLIAAGVKEAVGHITRARRALPWEYLGEEHGWTGRNREAMAVYAERGSVLHRRKPDGVLVDEEGHAA